MKFGTTLVLLLLTSAIAFVWWLDPLRPTASPVSTATLTETLARLKASPLDAITISRDSETIVSLQLLPSGWFVDGSWPANPIDVEALLAVLQNLESRFTPEILKEPTKGAVTVRMRQGEASHVLVFSELEVDPRFAKPTLVTIDDHSQALRLAPGLLGVLSKPADLYRQRRLFPTQRTSRLSNAQERIDILDAKELLISSKGNAPLQLVRNADGSWRITQPTFDKLDPDAAEKLLSAVADLWAEQFIGLDTVGALSLVGSVDPLSLLAQLSPQAQKQRLGLAEVERSIRVTRLDGSTVTLEVGSLSRRDDAPPPMPNRPPPPVDAFRYAQLTGSNLVFEIQDNRLADIFVNAEAIRDNRLARFTPEDAEKLTIREGASEVVLRKEQKEQWRMLSPKEHAADTERVKELLGKLSKLEAADKDIFAPQRRLSFLSSLLISPGQPSFSMLPLAMVANAPERILGLHQPTATITIELREKARPEDRDRSKPRTVTLELRNWDSRLALRSTDLPRVDLGEDTLSSLLQNTASVYRSKSLFDFSSDEVAQISLRRENSGTGLRSLMDQLLGTSDAFSATLQRTGEAWALTSPTTTTADTDKVNELLDAIRTAKATTFLSGAEGGAEMGPEYLNITLSFRDASRPKQILSVSRDRRTKTSSGAAQTADLCEISDELMTRLSRSPLAYLPSTLWTINESDIERFEITKADQAPYRLQRKGDQWQVSGPFEVAAPASVVAGLIKVLTAPKAVEYLAFNADAQDHGLAKPSVVVRVITKAGKTHTLTLGSARHAQVDTAKSVFLVEEALARSIDQSALDFLDRRLVNLDPESITSWQRQGGADPLTLTKAEVWKITKPSEQPGDDRAIPSLLTLTAGLTARKIVAYQSANVAGYGLEKPEAEINVAHGKETTTIALGKADKEGGRFVRVGKAPIIGVLTAEASEKLLAGPLQFRDRNLLRVSDADMFQLTQGDRKITFAKPEGTWKVTAPLTAEADHDGLEAFFNNLARLRADEFVSEKADAKQLDEWGLSKPVSRWSVFNLEDPKLELLIGKSKDNRRYAKLADRDLIFLLDEKLSAQATTEYRPRGIFKERIDPARIESVNYRWAKDPYELKKAGDNWEIVGKPEIKLDGKLVSESLAVLRDLKLERYAKDSAAQAKLFGLDPAELVLEITTADGKQTLEIGGFVGDSKERYAQLPGRAEVFILDEKTTERLTRNWLKR